MLKQVLAAPPENGAITTYTSELSHLLRNTVPGERADEIVTEAEAHLLDQTEVLMHAENIPRSAAEARAVADFTPAVTFAREMAQSAYETGKSQVWRRVGGAVGAGMLSFLLGLVAFGGFSSAVIPLVFFVFLLLAAVCAYQARQAQRRLFATWGMLATLFAFLYTGFFYVDGAPTEENWTQGSRASIAQAYDQWHADTLRHESAIMQLQLGLQTYQEGMPNQTVRVPAALQTDEGFVVPASYRQRAYRGPFRATRVETVPTLAEARARWQVDGPLWLARMKQLSNGDYHYEEPLQIALQQTGFARTAWWYAMVLASFAGCLVLVDGLFASLGRVQFTKRHRRYTKSA